MPPLRRIPIEGAAALGGRHSPKTRTSSIIVGDLKQKRELPKSKQGVVKASLMADIITHEKDDMLRECLLTDDGLMHAEMGYPGTIRLQSSERYRAWLLIDRRGYEFSIKQTDLDEFKLVSTYPEEPRNLLYDLVWHRAAEAMLAHRRGHANLRERRKSRKPKKERQEA